LLAAPALYTGRAVVSGLLNREVVVATAAALLLLAAPALYTGRAVVSGLLNREVVVAPAATAAAALLLAVLALFTGRAVVNDLLNREVVEAPAAALLLLAAPALATGTRRAIMGLPNREVVVVVVTLAPTVVQSFLAPARRRTESG